MFKGAVIQPAIVKCLETFLGKKFTRIKRFFPFLNFKRTLAKRRQSLSKNSQNQAITSAKLHAMENLTTRY